MFCVIMETKEYIYSRKIIWCSRGTNEEPKNNFRILCTGICSGMNRLMKKIWFNQAKKVEIEHKDWLIWEDFLFDFIIQIILLFYYCIAF